MKKLFIIIIVAPFAIMTILGLGYILLFNLSYYNAQPPRAPLDATVYGRVILAPNCPIKSDTNCEGKPYRTEVTVSYQPRPGADISVKVAKVVTNNDGHFTIPLRPSAGGVYAVHAKGAQPSPRCKSEFFEIKAKESLEINVTCDADVR